MISPDAFAFVQRSQTLALPWSLAGRPDFDFVGAVAALANWIESVPPVSTHVDRVAVSSATLRVACNVRRHLPTEAPAGPFTRHMRRRARVRFALEALAVLRNVADASLAMVASHVGVTETYMSHALRSESGLSFDRLVHALRMMDVVVLLRATNVAINEIATVTGYRALGAMDVVFRRVFDITPSAFRFAIHPRFGGIAEPTEAVREFLAHHPNALPAHIADATGVDLGVVLRASSRTDR